MQMREIFNCPDGARKSRGTVGDEYDASSCLRVEGPQQLLNNGMSRDVLDVSRLRSGQSVLHREIRAAWIISF